MDSGWLFWGAVAFGAGCYALVGATVFKWAAIQMRHGACLATDLALAALAFLASPLVVVVAGAAIVFDAFHDWVNRRSADDRAQEDGVRRGNPAELSQKH